MLINGAKVREARKNLGYSQDVLAKKLGVSKVTICWWENGDRNPGLENFLMLSDILGLSLDELAGREVTIVAQDDNDYIVKWPKKNIEIMNEILKKDIVYKTLANDPQRGVELIERKLK